ncbi:hypothetical protein J7W19_29315 [Streptomyces mobaraensis NBRC 13819 = DSM 40847]|uniref:Uncharacterized protein n=1 Tax=Streptomyces mobaraensis (strain ATCC 29032 / DSM 40847 / JCM 4168 / NBRC 13819 / NCIMB 11159 / IPCR 16-22) TaxID=1223523 RepID=M3CEI4_STRM1|nr:hypothetical protein [Streptomyces mobaraensis]EMF02411.1 hypothetical protein H340_01154 [Streptomyces mobaraensis NBRC 13819 = DSM 40847]QTT76938.1 hypothetical protein J7W19_29315 [Streptomyces mobaraensis NBRC 13819 = DSM 40847]
MPDYGAMPDPDEFAQYLKDSGFNTLDAQMNEATETIAKVITKGAELKKHAQANGFSEAVAEEIGFVFIERLISNEGGSK